MISLLHNNPEGTDGTDKSRLPIQIQGSPSQNLEGTQRNNSQYVGGSIKERIAKGNNGNTINTLFEIFDEDFYVEGVSYKAGLYFYKQDRSGNLEKIWVCSPIHIAAFTCNETGGNWGLLLKIKDPLGQWKEWAMPNYLLKGRGEEIRGELLSMGARIAPDSTRYLHQWLSQFHSDNHVRAVSTIGWYVGQEGLSFVFPKKVFGSGNVRFQSEYSTHEDFSQKGSLDEWKAQVATLCKKNPILLLAVSSSFVGPLLKLAKLNEIGGFGIHLMGDSSRGKTTALQAATSVWGSPSFMRTWRATANGLEAISAGRNDTFLSLDECGESDPREIGRVIYAIANGLGKQRANKSGFIRESQRWRICVLSSGECSITTHMQESGIRIKAGQEARMLDIPATNQKYGAFDYLHENSDPRAFADLLKQSTSAQYGHAGQLFIEKLILSDQDLPLLYSKLCGSSIFSANAGVESRAAGSFALIGLAGELASKFGLTGWDEDEALNATELAYRSWLDFRGEGKSEDRQILNAIKDFIVKHGDSRFSCIISPESVRNRAGWWKDINTGKVYMFSSEALREATPGFDLSRVLDTLEHEEWIIERDKDKRAKTLKLNGATLRLYCIHPK
jgi:putative DNA primase/helicase